MFNADIHSSFLTKPDEFVDISNAESAYNQVLDELLNKHEPLQEYCFTVQKHD